MFNPIPLYTITFITFLEEINLKRELALLAIGIMLVGFAGSVEDLSTRDLSKVPADLTGIGKEVFETQFFEDDLLGDYDGYTPTMTAFLTDTEFNNFEGVGDLYTHSMAEFLYPDETPTSAKSIDDFLYKKEVLDSSTYGFTDSMINFSTDAENVTNEKTPW